jgi:hypothetical protein
VGAVVDALTPEVRTWIESQPMFFVATAPSGPDGHVNLSPKGLDTLRVLDERTVAYLDLTGSGIETIAHLRDNGRITLMFCAFEGPPRILRLYGTGTVAPAGTDGFDELAARFPELPGRRAIITVACERISTSCGYAVPRMALEGDRDTLLTWADRRGPDGIEAYWSEKNAASIDGLPGL